MKKIAILILSFLFWASICYAGNADIYKITMVRVELKKSDGTWVTISSPNTEIDIAAVGAGASAAALATTIPVGTYVNFKIVNSETIKFSGSDGANYTNAGGTITITGTAATAASTSTWPADPPVAVTTLTSTNTHTTTLANQGEVTATLDLDAGDSDNYIEIYRSTDLTTPITVNADSVISMFFDFDTQGTVWHDGGTAMFFTPPQSGTQFQITVDGVTTTISEANMQVDF